MDLLEKNPVFGGCEEWGIQTEQVWALVDDLRLGDQVRKRDHYVSLYFWIGLKVYKVSFFLKYQPQIHKNQTDALHFRCWFVMYLLLLWEPGTWVFFPAFSEVSISREFYNNNGITNITRILFYKMGAENGKQVKALIQKTVRPIGSCGLNRVQMKQTWKSTS